MPRCPSPSSAVSGSKVYLEVISFQSTPQDQWLVSWHFGGGGFPLLLGTKYESIRICAWGRLCLCTRSPHSQTVGRRRVLNAPGCTLCTGPRLCHGQGNSDFILSTSEVTQQIYTKLSLHYDDISKSNPQLRNPIKPTESATEIDIQVPNYHNYLSKLSCPSHQLSNDPFESRYLHMVCARHPSSLNT